MTEDDIPETSNRTELDPSFLETAESKMRESFVAEAGTEAHLADLASALLVHVLVQVGPRRAEGVLDDDGELRYSAEPQVLILAACLFIGTRALGVIRAARTVLASGFEGEARALDRILVELKAHRRAIIDDSTGREALAWLRRRRTHRISKRVASMGDRELYSKLCEDSHGDPAPVLRDAEANGIELAPRRTPATRASLLMYAGFARDQAIVVSQLSGATIIEGVDELDAAIVEAWKNLEATSPASP